jgi:endonuclease YncB( thermonuclease family)
MSALFALFGWQMIKSFSGFALIALAVLAVVLTIRHWHKSTEVHTVSITIDAVDSGNTCHTERTGPLGRKRRGRDIRLIDIAVPAMTDELGVQSRDRVAQLVVNKTAELEVVGRVPLLGSLAGVLYSPEHWCINSLLVSEGLAWCTNDSRADWMAMQRQAQQSKLGVWRDYQQSQDEQLYLMVACPVDTVIGADPADEPVVGAFGVYDFSVTSWKWWVLLLLAVVMASVALNYHNIPAACTVVIIFITAMLIAGDLGVYLAVLLHPIKLLTCIGVYLLGAVLYGGFRWFLRVRYRLSQYSKFKAVWFRRNALPYAGVNTEIPDNLKDDWTAYVSSSRWVSASGTDSWTLSVVPDPWDSRDVLNEWMALWPISAVSFVFGGLFQLAWEGLFREFTALLSALSQKIGTVSSDDTPAAPIT